MSERGQVYTLEGLSSAILLLTAVLLSLQAIVITPTTAGTVDQDLKAQLGTQAGDSLEIAHENGSLADSALYWNNSSQTFYDPTPGDPDIYPVSDFGYGPETPPTKLGALLNQTFTQQGHTYSVFFEYRTDTDDPRKRAREPFVDRGEPTANAVTQTFTITLTDSMVLTNPDDNRTLTDLNNDPDASYFAPDIAPNGRVYNVIRVTVIVW